MTCLSSPSIMLRANDGTLHKFDPEQLRFRLISSCQDAGIKNNWLADDLTNAVENALSFQTENGAVFTESAINSFVIKLLQDAGYPNVAENFRKGGNVFSENIVLSQETVKNMFNSQLGIKGRALVVLTEKVLNVCDTISLKDASPSLILELGRHYKNTKLPVPKFKNLKLQNISASPWILSSSEIISLLSPDTRKLIEIGIIDTPGVSRLFPSLKINLRLERMATHYNLEPIVTELLLYPHFDSIADAVNEIITRVKRHFEINSKKLKLPIFLRFLDIYSFAEKYLGAAMPEGKKFCKEIAVMLTENLDFPVIVKGVEGV